MSRHAIFALAVVVPTVLATVGALALQRGSDQPRTRPYYIAAD